MTAAEASGQLRNIPTPLKVNNDLRWMGSGPNTGLGELFIPDLQPVPRSCRAKSTRHY